MLLLPTFILEASRCLLARSSLVVDHHNNNNNNNQQVCDSLIVESSPPRIANCSDCRILSGLIGICNHIQLDVAFHRNGYPLPSASYQAALCSNQWLTFAKSNKSEESSKWYAINYQSFLMNASFA